ncbi:MAG: hypothetical protein IEMM0008_0631 [bacterium]|nr:MAG: hypothetical protein IEMM0008_0631 [bacterium]
MQDSQSEKGEIQAQQAVPSQSVNQSVVVNVTAPTQQIGAISSQSRLVILLLCFFLGWLGVHRFYAGKIGTGILCAASLGVGGILWTIDFIMILVGSFRDKDNKLLKNW